MAIIETGESATPWNNISQMSNITTSSTRLTGSTSLSVDKSGTGATTGRIGRKILPFDATELRLRGCGIRFAVRHANWTNISATGVRLCLIYQWGDASRFSEASPFSGESFAISGATLAAGAGTWVSSGVLPLTGGVDLGGVAPSDAIRARVVGLRFDVVMGAAANTLTSVLLDNVELVLPAGGGALSLLEWSSGTERLVLPPFDSWLRGSETQAQVNTAEAATERLFVSHRETITATIRNVRSATTREGLRKWLEYAMANDGWGMQRHGMHMINATLDAASGAGESDPRRVNVADTTDAEWLKTTMGETVYVRVGPNSDREYEVGKLQSISAGNYLLLQEELKNAYASGDKCVSALENIETNYYPSLSLLDTNAIQKSGEEFNLTIRATETT